MCDKCDYADCSAEEQEKKSRPKGRRKKIWEIDQGYLCSVIGNCLKTTDLVKLARKKVFCLESGLSEYQVHSALVRFAGTRCRQSRALQKILDQKFTSTLAKFAAIKEEPAVKELWEQYLAHGTVSAAYCSAMSCRRSCREIQK